jgi:hypothetical protein
MSEVAPRAAIALLAIACGGAPPAASAPPRTSNVDLAAMRALLARHSPSGHEIVTAYETLPRRFVLGSSTITVRFGGDFGKYFDDAEPENLVGYMATAVHEVYHGYAGVMAYQLLAERGLPYGAGADALHVGAAPLLVPHLATYPSREMDATFPADARTRRYPTYVSPSHELQSTQQSGVFGLLDEWAAYLHSARTTVDFWPWVRDEAPVGEQLLVSYVSSLHEVAVPRAEFKLFVLHYLRHARDHRPDVYRALIDSPSFRRAFVACDQAWAALLAEAARLEPRVHAFARGRGVNAVVRGGQLYLGNAPWSVRDDAYSAVLRHLASPHYRQIEAALSRP